MTCYDGKKNYLCFMCMCSCAFYKFLLVQSFECFRLSFQLKQLLNQTDGGSFNLRLHNLNPPPLIHLTTSCQPVSTVTILPESGSQVCDRSNANDSPNEHSIRICTLRSPAIHVFAFFPAPVYEYINYTKCE